MAKKLENISEILIFVFAILLTNRGLWLCLTDFNDPLSFCSYQNIGIELPLYLLTSMLTVWVIVRRGFLKIFLHKWKKHKLVVAFIAFAGLSMIWSVFPVSTLYHVLILLFTTLLAAYIGTSFSSERMLTFLFWYAGITVVASFGLLLLFPNAAIMGDPHLGSWRGIYWHKNFTGSLMAFANVIFLLYAMTAPRHDKGRIVTCAVLYILSLIFVFFSKSVAGIVIWFVLNAVTFILLAWNRIKNHLTRLHYILVSSAGVLFGAVIVMNLGKVFGLLNRGSTLTGRIPLWNYLLANWVSKHPILGYGFGAIWQLAQFRQQTTTSQGWSFQITNGHNGFMDILLGLGGIGLLFALAILLLSLHRTGQYFVVEGQSEAVLPFLMITYFLASNLSISFFLEFESFHWMLLIAALFLTASNKKTSLSQEN